MEQKLLRTAPLKFVCIPQQRGLLVEHQNDIDRYYARGIINTMLVSRSRVQVMDGWVCYGIDAKGFAYIIE